MSFGACKPKGLNRIATIGYGYLRMREMVFSFFKLHYLRLIQCLITHVRAKALTTERVLLSETNSPQTEVFELVKVIITQ